MLLISCVGINDGIKARIWIINPIKTVSYCAYSDGGGPTNFSMQQPFWELSHVYPSEEAACALSFRVGFEKRTGAVNAERYEANDECHQSGGLPRRENHRGGEGIAICCTSEAWKDCDLWSESEVISSANCCNEKLT